MDLVVVASEMEKKKKKKREPRNWTSWSSFRYKVDSRYGNKNKAQALSEWVCCETSVVYIYVCISI